MLEPVDLGDKRSNYKTKQKSTVTKVELSESESDDSDLSSVDDGKDNLENISDEALDYVA